jgi:hypothetical protein
MVRVSEIEQVLDEHGGEVERLHAMLQAQKDAKAGVVDVCAQYKAECKRLGNANLDALTIAQALEELRRATDRFFSYTMQGNQTHIRVPWEAWDQLSVAYKNLPAWLFAEPAVDASRFDLLSKAKAAALHLGEALRYCASIAGQEGAGRAISSPYKAIEGAARMALETVNQ